ncbi:MAG: alpha-amylase [Verrucomicrobiae bacterium]|nr:alpha-amylase [Verrucomicrobiae bacterium]NNJ43182.1 alpha-amylase [Akkermansiaceae bacterium]
MLVEAVEKDQQEHGKSSSYAPEQHPKVVHLRQRIDQHVQSIYGEKTHHITDDIFDAASLTGKAIISNNIPNKWNQEDVIAITYADSIKCKGERPLVTTHKFFKSKLKHHINNIHILPFCPYSSDDGFSIIDYTEVHPEYGTWEDVQAFQSDFRIMADLVLNHCSRESTWFKNYCEDKSPGKGYFIDGKRFNDLSKVIRPRSSPLLHKLQTVSGEKEVWCTFSHDQVDLDYSNPEVLLDIIRIIRLYIEKGISIFRLDAVAFLWKEDGTNCVHRPQTHEIIKLLRLVIENLDPSAIIITETNVPNKENLSYFGNDNEAHLIYNFSLPPLMLHALLSGNCKHLNKWIMSMPPARHGRAYLNFIASHDGIGLRPAEGLLSEEEQESLVTTLRTFGGEISMRSAPDGEVKPYEANISLYSAMAGTITGGKDEWQAQRFLCAHTIILALEGLPAIYIHSLLGTENDHQGMAETGQARSINRHKWDAQELDAALSNKELHHQKVFEEMKRIIAIRRKQEAFHPNATQYTLHFGNQIFAFWRESTDRNQSIFALHNISSSPQTIPIVELNLIATEVWHDLLSGTCYSNKDTSIDLPPYGCVWISNKL